MSGGKEAKEFIARAQRAGWELLDGKAAGHYRMRWPATGNVVTVPHAPSEIRGLANKEAEMVRITGVALRTKPGPGRTKTQRAQDRRRREARARGPRKSSPVQFGPPLLPGWQQQLQDWSATNLADGQQQLS